MNVILGPGRDSFDAEIAHDHVTHLPDCAGLPRSSLNSIRDELTALIYRASSLASDDPARHWCCVSGEHRNYPQLAAKRIAVQELLALVAEHRSTPPFRYLPGRTATLSGDAKGSVPILEAKLLAAGLQSQVDAFTARTLATERRFLEAAERNPEALQELLNQIERVIRAEYDEALLVAERASPPYGSSLLIDVYERLRNIARSQPELVHGEPYEALVGMAGLLTGDCRFWWGPQFDLGGSV
jgi:hypothetical protein